MRRHLKVNTAMNGLAALMLSGALSAGLPAGALADAGSPGTGSQVCQSVIVKVRATHWVWLKETRKIHGRRVFVRRHGKIVRRHVRVSYFRLEPERLCTVTPLAALTPPSPVAPAAPAPVSPPVPVNTPPVVPPTEVITPPQPPVNGGLPSVSGMAASGQTLTAGPGAWSGSPTEYAYQWQRCNSAGTSCAAISAATAPKYALVEADVGSTLRVAVTASNSGGHSAAATSVQTTIATQASSTTFGKTTVGPHSDLFSANRKRVNSFTLPNPGMVSKLSIYLQPAGGGSVGQQALEGIIYADSGGKPGALLGVSSERVFHTSEPGGWYDLPFPAPLNLAAGKYWIGVITGETAGVAGYRYETVFGSRQSNENAYASGPSDPFGTPTSELQQMSLYATYMSEAPSSRPVNAEAPAISGVAESGQHLSASHGAWSESPTSYTYQWQRCNSLGASCSAIPGATSASYVIGAGDVNSTLRMSVSASDPAGPSTTPATSAPTPVVKSSTEAHHLEYVFNVGLVSVYDIDNKFAPAGTISLPQTLAGIRGVMVSPATHMMFVSYGGDSGGNGNGSVLAYNLESDEVKWEAQLSSGIDSGAVSPDGQTLYMPTGEQSSSGSWNIIDAENGAVKGTIEGGLAPHNTIASKDGKYVYLGGRYGEDLDVYETATGKVVKKIGPFGPVTKGVRPFTVNGSNTIAFTTATEFDGFQVSSITKGTVLSTIPFQSKEELQKQKEKEEQEEKEGKKPAKFPDSGYSHGISLSPDEKELYVVDAIHKEVRAYSVPNVAELEAKVEPTELAPPIPITGEGLKGTESPCAYDCGRGGWLQRSTDGHFVFVGDSGAVIDTTKREVVANLLALENTKISFEIDWTNGAPTATSGRTGVGEVP